VSLWSHRIKDQPDDEFRRMRNYGSCCRWNLRRRSACNEAEGACRHGADWPLAHRPGGLTSSILQSGYNSGPLQIVSARGRPAPAQQAEFSSLPMAFNMIRLSAPSWSGTRFRSEWDKVLQQGRPLGREEFLGLLSVILEKPISDLTSMQPTTQG
jgi:hypothetical protein